MFKYGIWVTASAFLSWVWYSILGQQTIITGFGFDSLFALGVIFIFYALHELIQPDSF